MAHAMDGARAAQTALPVAREGRGNAPRLSSFPSSAPGQAVAARPLFSSALISSASASAVGPTTT